MLDQADALRALVRDRVMYAGAIQRPPNVYTLAVTSGKGGVGKTSIAVNLAMLLAGSGRRVRLIDADFGLSNAEVLMGVKPRYTMEDVLQGRIGPRDAWTETLGGVLLLSSGSGLEEMANINGTVGLRLIDLVLSSAADGDILIIDTAPGINESVTSLLTFATEVMVVTTPEPASITDSYAAIKVLLNKSKDADITLVANCCDNPSQANALASSLDGVCKKFLNRSFNRHEYLPADATMSWAARIRRPVIYCSPHATIAPWLRKIAIKLESRIKRQIPSAQKVEMVEA